MAKDSKKEKLKNEQKSDKKDKDIHLNVVGVPKRNVDVKKTYPRQNNEEYQLYRISIDTKGKQKERKRRLSSLESAPKKTKDRKRLKSNDDNNVTSDDSYTNIPRPQKSKPAGGTKDKQSTPKPGRKSCDSEICITIPGEKGKGIRIVGSGTKPLDDKAARESSFDRPKRKQTESPRQVGFARLDEVYGTTPEESSIESRGSLPYRRTPQQVYKIENDSPNAVFKDPTSVRPGRSTTRGNDEKIDKSLSPNQNLSSYSRPEEQSKPNLGRSQTGPPSSKSSKQGHSQLQPEGSAPLGVVHVAEYDKPSTSKPQEVDKGAPESVPSGQSRRSSLRPANRAVEATSSTAAPSTSYTRSSSEPTSGSSTEGKGKYPFYPYDKQKRSKSPLDQLQEPNSAGQDDKEPRAHQKLASIPEVRSRESYLTPQSSKTKDFDLTHQNSSVSKGPIATSNKALVPVNIKENLVPRTQTNSKPVTKLEELVPDNGHSFENKPNPNKFPPLKNNASTGTSPSKSINNSPKLSQPVKYNTQRDTLEGKPVSSSIEPSKPSQIQPSHSTLSNTKRSPLEGHLVLSDTPKPNQQQIPTQKKSQATSPMTPKLKRNNETPVLNYNIQNSPSKLETPAPYNKQELPTKPQLLTPIRSRYSTLQEKSANKPQNLESLQESTFKKNEDPLNNKTPNNLRRPETVDKEIMTDKVMKPKERILLEINEELNRKSSPLTHRSLQGSAKDNVSSHDKDSKRSKSKLSNFVSSIPKPLFRRKKSLEKKSTEKSVVGSDRSQSKLSPLAQNPETKGNISVKDDARKPVEESPIMKKLHEPAVEAYPAWITSSDQQEVQPQPFKYGSPSTDKSLPKNGSKEFLPEVTDKSSSVEIANRSYGEHPLIGQVSTTTPVAEQMKRLGLADEEEPSPNYLQDVDSYSREPQYAAKKDEYLQASHSDGSTNDDLERTKDTNNNNIDKSKIFEVPNVLAYPGKTYGDNPFGYEYQSTDGSKEENQSIPSLEDAFEGYKRPEIGKNVVSTHLVDRNSSLVSRASRNPEEESKKTFHGHQNQVLKGSTSTQLFSEKLTPMEVNYDPNKTIDSTNKDKEHEKRAANKLPSSKESENKSNYTPAGLNDEDAKTNPSYEKPFGQTPKEQQVYAGHVPDKTYGVFRPEDSDNKPSPNAESSEPVSNQRQGPKGILIFVNRKNETGNPFQKKSPSRKMEDNISGKSKNKNGPKKGKKGGKSSSGDTSASASVQSAGYASGDNQTMIERSPSGRKTTERYPCGCIRVITSNPENQLKKDELISAYCKDGSRCEVSRAQRSQLGTSLDSSLTWEGSSRRRRTDAVFPDIEVIADGVVSRRPIAARPAAPSMNGAKLTGCFKIKSNKVNGVCNLYLDRKLKNYLRNNMDKIQQLLEDG